MPRKKKALNFKEKLLAIRHALDPIVADRNNGEYDFVPASTLMMKMRAAFDEHRLLLDVEEKEQTVITLDGLLYCQVKTEFTVEEVDTETRRTRTVFGAAWASDGTAIGKAKTLALKYFLRNVGTVPFLYMEDADEDPRNAVQTKRLTKAEKQEEKQLRAFDSACHAAGITYAQARDYLTTKFGRALASELSKAEFDEAMKYPQGAMPLAEVLEMSVKANGEAKE